MAPKIEDILLDSEFDPTQLERISTRSQPHILDIVEPDPSWHLAFQEQKARILAALGTTTALAIAHAGSTSVPGLPAKPVIDIDLTVPDPADEAAYAPRLEAAGYQFLIREPRWHGHRFFASGEGEVEDGAPAVNLHVWGPDCAEVARHRIFGDWLRGNAADRELYARTKWKALGESKLAGETVMQYNKRKEDVIREILRRAFRALGYIE